MLFNQADKELCPKAFDAIKWLISKSEAWRNETEDSEWGMLQTIDRSFKGNIPWYMRDELHKLTKIGYCHPRQKTIGNLHWFSGTTEHRIHWNFGQYKSSQNRIEFYYTTYNYLDGFPEGIQDAA